MSLRGTFRGIRARFWAACRGRPERHARRPASPRRTRILHQRRDVILVANERRPATTGPSDARAPLAARTLAISSSRAGRRAERAILDGDVDARQILRHHPARRRYSCGRLRNCPSGRAAIPPPCPRSRAGRAGSRPACGCSWACLAAAMALSLVSGRQPQPSRMHKTAGRGRDGDDAAGDI